MLGLADGTVRKLAVRRPSPTTYSPGCGKGDAAVISQQRSGVQPTDGGTHTRVFALRASTGSVERRQCGRGRADGCAGGEDKLTVSDSYDFICGKGEVVVVGSGARPTRTRQSALPTTPSGTPAQAVPAADWETTSPASTGCARAATPRWS